MRYKSIKTLFKLFVIIALVLTTAACGGNDRYNKYMKIVKKEAKVFEVIGNIQEDSVVMSDDGILTFNSVTSDGVVIPFVATGVRYENGVLIFTPQGKVDALKSVGQILAYHPIVSEPSDYWNSLDLYGSYTFSEVTEVDSVSVLTSSTSSSKNTFSYDEKNGFIEMFSFLPNFIGFKADRINNVDEFTLTKLNVYYTTDTYTTGIKYLTVDEKSFVAQLDGYLYDASNEGMFDVETGIFDFYLVAVPDVYDEDEFDLEKILSTGNYRTVYGIEGETMVVGDLKDAQGNVLDKNHAKVEKGMTLDIHFGDNTQVLSLPVVERYENAKTMKELLPNVNSSSIGDLNVLVIPINWSDEEATDDKLQTMKEMMGRVFENGSVVDYTTDTESLSSYYDKSSYGQLRIIAHFTDWYQSEYTFAEMKYENLSKERYVESNKSAEPERITYAQDIFSWVHDTQNIDKEVFDQDGNQLYDAVIFLNAGDVSQDDGYSPLSFTGGYMQSSNYTGVGLSDGSNLGLNAYASIHTALGANTVIHEFGHLLGLIDYYDVSYSGYDAVGGYDMQSASIGDWNPFSKYAVGWTNPTIVENLAIGESVDIEIGAFMTTGDTIVIPAAGSTFDGPFGEYIMVDLLTDDGLAMYQSDGFVGISKGESGVRMNHVNGNMERRELQEDGEYIIGTTHNTNVYNKKGIYNIEMIQSSGENTFTNKNREYTIFDASHLFQENDEFTAEEYSEFMWNGKMDDGADFGYSIKVVSIDKVNGEYKAVIRVTRD